MNFHRMRALFVLAVLLMIGGCAREQNSRLSSVQQPWREIFGSHRPLSESTQLVNSVQRTKARLATVSKTVTSAVTPVPSHNKIWRPEYSILPIIDFDGWEVRIRNVRDSRYRSLEDCDVRHYDMSFYLTDLVSVDFAVVPFQKTDFLAHTMLAFGLKDGRHFLVSVEARLEKGEAYSTTAGLRKEFELMYVIGDERDLIPLRTRVRQVDCFLYPGRAMPSDVQRLFMDIMKRVNQIAKTPEFYHTLSNNCTTNLVQHVNNVFPDRIPMNDWRLVLPGRSDRLAYELGLLDVPNENFEQVRWQYRITDQARLYEGDPNFSAMIRQRR